MKIVVAGGQATRSVARHFIAGQARFAGRLGISSLAAAIASFAAIAVAQDAIAPGAKVSVVFDHELPNAPGKSMRVVLVEYAPGAGSPSHRHPTSAFIYARVLEGAIRSKRMMIPSVHIRLVRAGRRSQGCQADARSG